MYKYIIFDLDGTLMDTLNDIKDAMNVALKQIGYNKQFNYEEAKSLVGSGAYVMMERAIRYSNGDIKDLDKLGQTFLPLYKEYQGRTTRPYDGMVDTLKTLKSRGYKLFILTNKPHHLVTELFDKFFGYDLFSDYQGQIVGEACKPDPTFTYKLLNKHNIKVSDCLFVGDSNIDVLVGKNVNMDTCLCLYGYGDEATRIDTYPKYKINTPKELLDILK